MRKWRKQQVFCLLLACMIGLFGCARTRVVDQISIIHVFGFDQAENGDDLIGTALIPDYSISEDTDKIKSIEEQAPNGILFVPKMAAHTSMPIELAKIRVLVFGKSYAESGINDMVERFILTPELGTNAHIAVSTDSARETLNTFKQEKSLTLAERIEHNMVGQHLPNVNLHYFLNYFYGEGMDAFVPMITIDEKKRVKIEGIGIFGDDKLKHHLKTEQTTLISYLINGRSQATHRIDLNDKDRRENIIVKNFRSKTDWNWDQKNRKLDLDLQLKMTLIQYPNRFNLEKAEDLMEIRDLSRKNLEKKIQDLLKNLQENEVDPIGIGNIVRTQDRTWEEESFYEEYPNIPINVKLDLQIIHSGLEG